MGEIAFFYPDVYMSYDGQTVGKILILLSYGC